MWPISIIFRVFFLVNLYYAKPFFFLQLICSMKNVSHQTFILPNAPPPKKNGQQVREIIFLNIVYLCVLDKKLDIQKRTIHSDFGNYKKLPRNRTWYKFLLKIKSMMKKKHPFFNHKVCNMSNICFLITFEVCLINMFNYHLKQKQSEIMYPSHMGYSLRKCFTLLEKPISSYAYHTEECKIPLQMNAPAVT